MAPTIKKLAEIRDDQLREIKNLLPDADVGSDSDFHVRASGVASAIEGLYAYQQWQTKQIFPDTADPEFLLRHAALYRMSLKPAVSASGMLKVSGNVQARVPSGLQFNLGAVSYTTTSGSTIGIDGTTVVTASANVTGSTANITDPVAVQLMSVPAGIQTQALLLTMSGGLETETYGQLLGRLLDRLRNPPGAGKVSDYRRWALEVPGITAAFVFPHRTAVGRIDVAVISGTGVPSDAEISAAQLNIDMNRPAACRGVTVFAPELLKVDHLIRVSLSGIDEADCVTALTPQFAAYYDTLVPGAAVIKSKLEAIVDSVPGVTDRIMDSPASNVQTIADSTRVQWARLGNIVVEKL
ncbi:baseplate J/gp47 family protein [Burkholderia cenocepacia]|uniref:baseplate J/gp47 family protein n=1 Tax=Burkholderia cenocepacia TaxID=95486 RepID=UPI002AB755DD|nr:baseplate J/gp47 family protein [Burkholderia cenocepacia]